MAILLDKIIGHSSVIEHFRKQIETGRMHHAFLFAGQRGVGRRTLAIALAQALLCKKGPLACGFCSSCLSVEALLVRDQKKTENLLLIEPEKNQIKIDQAHEIREFLSLQMMGRGRVVIIDSADKMNAHAANSLLKLVEEPPESTTFFMMTPTAHHVLSTIRSRSQVVAFGSLNLAELKTKMPGASEWALRMAQGSLEVLSEMMDTATLQAREIAISWIEDWMNVPQAFMLEGYREFVKDRGQGVLLSQLLLGFFRDLYFLKIQETGSVFNVDKLDRLQKLSQVLSASHILFVMKKTSEIEAEIESHFDIQLIYEKFWIQTSPQVLMARSLSKKSMDKNLMNSSLEQDWKYVY